MTEPLLPPDPTRDAQYYLTRAGWNIGKRVEIWRWCPDEPIWRNEQWGPMGPDLAGKAGYTLASPHPIPTAAQLDALHKLADDMAKTADSMENSQANGTVMHGFAKKLRDRLRAALKGDAP